MPTLPNGVEQFHPDEPWSNAHQNFTHVFKKDASYALRVFSSQSTLTDYNATTANIQFLIKQAIANGITLRAMGNNWSFSKVAVCNGGLISTKALNLRFRLANSSFVPQFLASGKTKQDVIFVQCGITILELSEHLETMSTPRRCLVACGGSNGQSVAGASSTGTHGGALNTGALHDAILGLHIVTGPDTHVWLERSSNPVVSDEFINRLGAERKTDDELFNAAVVSFGSFGVIHGILLETAPLFLLEEHRFDNVVVNDALITAIQTQNIALLKTLIPNWPDETPQRSLYHLELAINPHQFERNNASKGIYIRTFYKIPCPDTYKPVHDPVTGGLTYADDTMGIVSQILDKVGSNVSALVVKPLVNALFKSALRAAQPAPKTMGETFRHTRFRGQIASAAFAVDCANVFAVVDIICALNAKTPLAGGLAFRFVKGTKATLGFTKFAKTCVIEMDGLDAKMTRAFFEKVWVTLEEKNIPYTLHWGKMNFILNSQRVKNMYGNNNVTKWIQARHQLLSEPARKVFTNDFMIDCGLDV
jgi:hypothetical protein